MYGGIYKKRRACNACISIYLIIVTIFSGFGNALIQEFTTVAEAAQVAIDTSVSSVATSFNQAGSQTVFTSDQVGYKFYRDSSGICVYSKTTNGGTSWGSAVTVDAQTDCIQIQIWYDKWTPGITTNFIHIATLDTSSSAIFYNRLNPSGDVLLLGSTPVNAVSNSAQGGSITQGENYMSLTRGTDGTIYAVSNDGTNPSRDSYIVECTVTCETATNWTETGTNPLDVASDFNLLVPLSSGSIMLINRDVSAEVIRSKIWNNVSWSATWTTIDSNAPDNTTYDVGMAVTVSSTTPIEVYLAYTSDTATLGTDDDIRTRFYNGSWNSRADVITNTARGITGVAIALDTSPPDVYVGYTARSTAGTASTGNVYWKRSTDKMASWDSETGPVNSTPGDLYGVDLNIKNDQRIYESWYSVGLTTIYGDTIADVFPGVHVTTNGSQIATAKAKTNNLHIGGSFVFYQNYITQTVTAITITENGSINGATDIANIKLRYEMDSVAPYDCASVSYDGTEPQFGSTDSNGFSGPDGVSSFSGTSVNVSTTSALCVYVVMDILDSALDTATLNVTIANPSTDVTVTGATAGPTATQDITGLTTISNDRASLMHYHWRNDDGVENAATSRTSGNEDTPINSLPHGTPVRLRLVVSNMAGSSTPAMQFRLEFAPTTGTCLEATGWTDVGAADDEFNMYDSSYLTNGANTIDIANSIGGVTNENTTLLTPNGGIRDTSSQTGPLVLSSSNFVELEYSIIASTTAPEGNTYCFRVTDAGAVLPHYQVLPRATIAADVSVTVTSSSQTATVNIPTSNFYVGGAFVVTENTSSRNVTSVTISENGTADAQANLDNIRLYYDIDVSAPFDCEGEDYPGGATQFGLTDTDGFSGPNGTSTFTDSIAISTTATLCLYVVVDVLSTAVDGNTINVVMESPSTNLVVTGGGKVSPSITRDLNGETTMNGPVLTQTHYHWRRDNGSELTASSTTNGIEDTPITYVAQTTPVRLRLEVANLGSVSSPSATLILEYGTKITSCAAVSSWTDVGGVGGAWDMFDSTYLTEAANTTNISIAAGGVTDSNTTFLTPNNAVKDTSSTISAISLSSSNYLEGEFSIKQTEDAGYNTTYCFRLVTGGSPLNIYTVYPELTTSPRRDFEIQRGTTVISGTSATINAGGVHYETPSSASSAFIRITNSHHTGAGTGSGGGNQNADDVTAYISNPGNIMNSITFTRAGSTGDTRVSWEIIEFIGDPGSDNEMIVRNHNTITYGTAATIATGTSPSGIVDDADVVVFITGQYNPDTGRGSYNAGQSTSAWNATNDVPVFTRGIAGGLASRVSYAVVEFTGQNWAIQRSEHNYVNVNTTETESISSVNSLTHTFLHTQKRMGASQTSTGDYGHDVWLSSIGAVSYLLDTNAGTPSLHYSVAWVIENTQTTVGEMDVTPSNGSTDGGSEPLTVTRTFGKTLVDITNASIFATTRSTASGAFFPRPIAGVTINSSTTYQIWRSDTGELLTYRVDIVEWPTAGVVLTQNYYRFYVDNNALDPTDPWPVGALNLGENTTITEYDEPPGDGEVLRLRMSVRVTNASVPAQTRSFKLQYALLDTTCSAITEVNWNTLGDDTSGTIWRGYNASGLTDGTALSSNPPTAGDLNLSVSDVAGTLEEKNNSAINPFKITSGDDVEYDWIVQQNGAAANTVYCFRMIDANGTLLDAYAQYPQLRTAKFTPRTQNWRWYDDIENDTPSIPLAAENVSPVDVANTQTIGLRVTVKDIKNVAQNDVRFKLQYSETQTFANAIDVVAIANCTATSTWCYTDGAGTDNQIIPSKTLSDADSCVGSVGDGCGTFNESPTVLTGYRHENAAAAEYAFSLLSAAPRVNLVYYFRLYDVVLGIPVVVNTGKSYPSLVTEGAHLSYTMSGLASGSNIEGVTLDISSTPNSIPFGTVAHDTMIEGAHRFSVDTNGTEGYQLYVTLDGDITSSFGTKIGQITGTNAAPTSWSAGCSPTVTSCFGYHTSDDTLYGGSTRFSAIDTYARISTTTLDEVSYSSQPADGDITDIVFRIYVRQLQSAGQYEARLRYISLPIF